jgi:uncharacterized protein involved in exopolysaccharide biosynthesis
MTTFRPRGTLVPPSGPRQGGLARPSPFAAIGAVVRRQRRLVIICFLALATGAVAAVLMATPFYQGQMKILVKRDRADSVVSGAADPATSRDDLSETELLSQVELMRANDLIERVAREAGLTQRLVASGAARNDAEAVAQAAESLRKDLTISPVRRTWLIDVGYRAEDPQLTRNVLDTMLRVYMEKHLSLHRPSGTYQFFADQAEGARREWEAAKAQLAEFSQRTSVVSAVQEREGVVQQLLQFDAMRAQAEAARAEAARRLAVVSSDLSTVPARQTAQVRTTDSAGLIQDAQARIVTLEMKRAELLQKFTPSYRGVIEVDQQLRDARAALEAARSAPVREETIADNPTRQWLDTEATRVRAEHAAAQARAQALAAAVGQYRVRAQTLDRQEAEEQALLQAVTAAEQKYRLYAQKQEEARISDELDRTRIANVAVAEAPSVAFKPERTPSLAMLPVLLGIALFLSFAFAFVVDALGATRTPLPGSAPADAAPAPARMFLRVAPSGRSL